MALRVSDRHTLHRILFKGPWPMSGKFLAADWMTTMEEVVTDQRASVLEYSFVAVSSRADNTC